MRRRGQQIAAERPHRHVKINHDTRHVDERTRNCAEDAAGSSPTRFKIKGSICAWQYAFHTYGPHWLLVAFTILFSLIGVVLWGTLSGSMLPFILKRVGLDPAASSAPFVATLVDVTGIVIYFHVAVWTLGGNLLSPRHRRG